MSLLVHHLRVDHIDTPMGVVESPTFAWQIAGEQQDLKQAAYSLQVSDTPDFAAPFFDTDRIESDNSICVKVEGLRLESARRYWWRVEVEAGGEAAWSRPATFVTGLMEGFTAQFVTAETAQDARNAKGTAVAGSFTVDGEVAQAYAYCSALGVYHLYLDGQRVDETEMAPGWTSYHNRLQYQTIDLTARLTAGEHTLLAPLGDGWYKGEMGFLHRWNNYGDRTAFLCEVVIRYADGRVQHVVTDERWTGYDTGVSFSSIYHGETFDARVGLHAARPAAIHPWRMETLLPQLGCAAKVIQTMPVKAIITTPRGDTVLDFGQNLTGFVRFTARGAAGEKVLLQFFETLDAAGNVYTANLRSARQTIDYTLRGEGDVYQPQFTFQGFRYVHVKAWPGEVKPEQFTACVVHSAMEPTASFRCSDKLVNQLWHNILWGLKGNFLDVPTDCPQRDERLGWTGDAQIFSTTACILMNAYPFFAKWLRDVAADQTEEGGVPHVVPDVLSPAGEENKDWLTSQGSHSAAAWADAATLIPWNMYVAYGDKEILADQYHSMKAWADFMYTHSKNGTWDYKLQFGDWVALDAAEGSYYGATPNELTCTAYYAWSTLTMAKAAAVLGKTDDEALYRARHRDIVRSFQEKFFDAEGNLTAQTQTAHVLALHFGLAPDKWRQKTLEGLKKLLDERGGHLVTGFVGTPHIAHALSDNGALADAYDLVLKKDFPSWLYQVTAGATTVWEHWDGIKPDGTMWSADMNSFNHYAYGAIGEWLFKVMGGIRPDERDPGYHTIRFTPRPGGGITHAEAAIDTPYGMAAITWLERDGVVEAAVTVPGNAQGVLEVEGIALDDSWQEKGGLLTAEFGSGSYIYRWKMA